ncbi:MAG: mechanosensitive ion channel family protein [gamma proteobacterium symbiont of Bathyaustriella thionipta]|nr:mechanosensitive ion channel family protein [gamma proteobacterium symbiont of Bathyaustriella thionipta]MCU7949850.1 mechanosensitive ion channel family protein [gamma proteobacterium symbiont of Bathyaustriella thionipta]MCU7954608.1 mechanosensitive ion channel family protein [gamma proteobacterium symbiont of Bathyaustriella thionipta]MCU7956541.1 mechanosensitive ion channel family protein [gamma proteobacterium symbiont of Bathyaustriella thionipta]MCU7966947.1 mechanosensitive ion cha
MDSAEFELKQWLLQLEFLRGDGLWISEVFLIVLIALVLDFIKKRVLKKVHTRLERTANPWDDAFIESVSKPLSAFIWLWGISIAANVIANANDVSVYNSIVQPARHVGIIIILTWFVLRMIVRIEHNIIKIGRAREDNYDISTVQAITKLIRVSVFITGALIMLQELGVSVAGVLAFGGIGGMAVGFAAKDLLSNFFGGLMLYLDRPFAVGDWIRSPDKNIEGTVENIGWRLTKIRTFDKRPLYVPNSTFATISVENPSRMTNRRIKETIGVRYDDGDKLDAIITDIHAMLKSHNDIDTRQTLMVNFNEFAPSSLDFFIYTFTKTTNWVKYHKIKQDVLFQIMKIIQQHGAEMAFPTSTLHLNGELSQKQLPETNRG